MAGVPFFDFIDSQLDPTIREDLRWWDRENTGDIERDRARLDVLLAHQPPRARGGAAPAPRRRPRPALPPEADRGGRGGLRARGQVCDYVVYPDEGHEISGLAHRIDYDRRTVEFILEHTGSA